MPTPGQALGNLGNQAIQMAMFKRQQDAYNQRTQAFTKNNEMRQLTQQMPYLMARGGSPAYTAGSTNPQAPGGPAPLAQARVPGEPTNGMPLSSADALMANHMKTPSGQIFGSQGHKGELIVGAGMIDFQKRAASAAGQYINQYVASAKAATQLRQLKEAFNVAKVQIAQKHNNNPQMMAQELNAWHQKIAVMKEAYQQSKQSINYAFGQLDQLIPGIDISALKELEEPEEMSEYLGKRTFPEGMNQPGFGLRRQ